MHANACPPDSSMTRLSIYLALICASLATSFVSGSAQTVHSSTGENFTVDAWSVQEGLPQGTVTAITQSANGYLWMGTYAGLVRFDGMRFVTYDRLDQRDPRPRIIAALASPRDSSIWVGTPSGGLYVLRGDSWTALIKEHQQTGPIRMLVLDENGIVWIGTEKGGLLRGARTREGKDTILVSFVQPDFSRPEVSSIHLSHSGSLWVGGGGGIAHIFGTGIRTYRFSGKPAAWTVKGIATDTAGRVWVGFPNGEVYRFDTSTPGYLIRVRFGPSYWFNEVFDQDRPYLSLGVLSGGLNLVDGRFLPKETERGRFGDKIVSMYRDKEQNYWFGSSLSGLIRVRSAPFEMIRRPFRQSVTSLFRRSNGEIYAGFNCGGVGIIRGNALELAPVTARFDGDCVWSLFIDRQDRMWVGTWGGGVYRTDLRDPSTRAEQFARESFIGSDVVLAIAEAPDGAMWFGTYDAGVARYHRGRSRRWSMSEGLPGNDVRAIAFDSVGGVWIGTQSGLALIQDTLMRSFTVADGLTSGAIRTLTVERNGTLWIGTQGGGLIRFRNGVFRPITREQGLFDNTVSHFMEGAKGFMWMGSNRGIWRVSKDELNAVADQILPRVNAIAYGKDDGLLVVETNGGFQPNGVRTPEGDLFFPTMNGVARVRTRELRVNTTPPPVIIERVSADGEPLPRGGSFTLAPNTEEVSIAFTALSFTAPEKVRFRYQLRGYNKNWVDAGGDRSAVFTNLGPGTYTFTVTAANNDGFWNEDGAEITILVQTPFWESTWFRGLSVLMLIGMGMLVVSVRLRQVRKQKEIQEQTSQRLIRSQEEERQRIAGELHDSLGQELIVAKNRVLLAAHHLPEESKARSELTQVAEALSVALKSVRTIAYNLRPFQLDRLGLTETIRSTVRTIQQATTIRFETEIENIDGLLTHEGEIGLFRVVQEALTNVVKHSDATRASVVVTRDEDAVVMRVTDDGKGFEHDPNLEKAPMLGFGIPGMTERVRLLRGIYKINSAPGKGTTVAVRLPARKHMDQVYG